MLPNIMKWVSSVALLLAGVFWSTASQYQLLLTATVFMGAMVVLYQAIRNRQYVWVAGFAAIALVFNPAVPVFQASGPWFRMTALVCTVIFAISLSALKTRPLLSVQSITSRHRESESL